MDNKKKILVVTNLYPTFEKKTWGNFVKEQVVSLKNNYDSSIVIDVYLVNGQSNKLNYLKALFYLPYLVLHKNYDLVHVHYGLTLISTMFVPVPIVTTWHGSDILVSIGKKFGKLLNKRSNKTICVSENIRRALGYGIIIPCGIDTNAFAIPELLPVSASIFKAQKNKKLNILFPSDPALKVKNYPLFKNVCTILTKKGFRVNEIHLKGIPRSDVPSLFWEADLMLLTSFSEGSPTVIKEAIAAKLPFISLDIGDVKHWCGLIDFGLVVESSDPDEIASQSISLLKSTPSRVALDNSTALKYFDQNAVTRKIFDVYKDLL